MQKTGPEQRLGFELAMARFIWKWYLRVPSRAPPLSWRRKRPLIGIFRGIGLAAASRPGTRTQNGTPPPRRARRRGFQSGREGGAASSGLQVQVPWEPQHPEGSPTSHAQNALEELLRFRFFTILRSAATTYILPRGARSRGITREFKAHNSSAARSQRFAALRGGSHPAAMFITREPPQNHPPSPHPSPPLPPRSAEAAAQQSRFQLSPHPLAVGAARRLRGVRLRGSAGGGGAAGLKRPERRGAGEGLGPGPSLLFPRSGSPLRPRPGSRTCALKTHFKVCSRRGGGPLRAGPRTLAPPHRHAGRQPSPGPHSPPAPDPAKRPGGPSQRTPA